MNHYADEREEDRKSWKQPPVLMPLTKEQQLERRVDTLEKTVEGLIAVVNQIRASTMKL